MKSLTFYRYKSADILTLPNGDKYNSIAILRNDKGKELWRSDHVNVDSTQGYRGGRLACSDHYFGIRGHNSKGRDVLRFFKWINADGTVIKTEGQLDIYNMTLPSDIPNPNHAGKMFIQYVQFHSGGNLSDWSHGCFTCPVDEFKVFIDLLKQNEIVQVIVTDEVPDENKLA